MRTVTMLSLASMLAAGLTLQSCAKRDTGMARPNDSTAVDPNPVQAGDSAAAADTSKPY